MKRLESFACVAITILATGCDRGSASEPTAPPAPGSYVLFEAPTVERGWDALDALDAQLTPDMRHRLEAKGLAGQGTTMMVRFTGQCARDRDFVAAVRHAVEKWSASQVRCTANWPAGG